MLTTHYLHNQTIPVPVACLPSASLTHVLLSGQLAAKLVAVASLLTTPPAGASPDVKRTSSFLPLFPSPWHFDSPRLPGLSVFCVYTLYTLFFAEFRFVHLFNYFASGASVSDLRPVCLPVLGLLLLLPTNSSHLLERLISQPWPNEATRMNDGCFLRPYQD